MSILRYMFLFVIIIAINSCSSTIAMYDQYAYAQVTSLKVDVLEVMDEADQDYAENEKEIRQIDVKLRKAVEYERHRPKNEIVNEMWSNLLDPKAFLYGGFIERWQQNKKLEVRFITEQKRIVALAFDQIAELQSKMTKKK